MIVVIDNYDSFTYNLVQYLGMLGAEVSVYRNDAIDLPALRRLAPTHLVISPGPGNPDEAGISNQVIRELGPAIPTLGVCLGQQCIGQVFGGRVVRAPRLLHGKTSPIYHYGDGLFLGLPNPFEATRYHSLIVEQPLPPALEATAFTREGELMGLAHRQYPIYGVQFHPESILTTAGMQILRNFLSIARPVGDDPGLSISATNPQEEAPC
jgi:anthranilate synthase/aminodeoxychorismate synthase-like glutamine amidotransferase